MTGVFWIKACFVFPSASLSKEASLLWVCAKSLLPTQRVHLCLSEILWRPTPQVHLHAHSLIGTSLIFCCYSLNIFITHANKQIEFFLAGSFHSDKGSLSRYNWRTRGNTTLQYSNQGQFLFHIPLRLNDLIKVCVYLCMYWLRLMEELTNTMQPLFSSGDEQSGTDFRCPEGFRRPGIQPDSYTHAPHASRIEMLVATLIYALHVYKVSSQVCIFNWPSTHAQVLFKLVFTSVFVWTRICGLVCWFSVGAGNQEGTIDPWRVEKKGTETEGGVIEKEFF